MNRKLKFLTLPAAGLSAILVGALAWAYWSTGGSGSAEASVATLDAPASVTATIDPPADVNRITVEWAEVSSPAGGATGIAYTVERQKVEPGGELDLPDTPWTVACSTLPNPETGTSCDDDGLADGKYRYRVTALFRTWTANDPSVVSDWVEVVNDSVAPASSATYPAPNGAGWHKEDVEVSLSADDNVGGSGVASITYAAAGVQTIAQTAYTGPFTISAEGTTTISFFATDNAGNVETSQTQVIRLDKTAPAVSAPIVNG
jgi:hypothetical protein